MLLVPLVPACVYTKGHRLKIGAADRTPRETLEERR